MFNAFCVAFLFAYNYIIYIQARNAGSGGKLGHGLQQTFGQRKEKERSGGSVPLQPAGWTLDEKGKGKRVPGNERLLNTDQVTDGLYNSFSTRTLDKGVCGTWGGGGGGGVRLSTVGR